MSTQNFLHLRYVCPTKLIRLLCLNLVLQKFERPNDPECSRRHDTCGKELAYARIHERCVPSAYIEHANEGGEEADVADEDHSEAFVDLIVAP